TDGGGGAALPGRRSSGGEDAEAGHRVGRGGRGLGGTSRAPADGPAAGTGGTPAWRSSSPRAARRTAVGHGSSRSSIAPACPDLTHRERLATPMARLIAGSGTCAHSSAVYSLYPTAAVQER